MTTAPETNRGPAQAARADGLAAWAEASGRRQDKRNAVGGLRFAFYGLWGSGTRLSVLTWASMQLARTR